MGRVIKFFFHGISARQWMVAAAAGIVSFGSVSWLVSAGLTPGIPSSLPPVHMARVELPPPADASEPKQATETQDLPDITIDSLKAAGITEAEIMRAVDKLLEEKSLQS